MPRNRLLRAFPICTCRRSRHAHYGIYALRLGPMPHARVEFRPMADKILIYVKLDPSSITLEPGFTRDVTDIGHYGTGDLEITLAKADAAAGGLFTWLVQRDKNARERDGSVVMQTPSGPRVFSKWADFWDEVE